MADFAKALKQGFEAIDAVWTARQEIEEVFARLSKAALEVTDGKVRIELDTAGVTPTGAPLVAVADGDRETHVLAFVDRSDGGYPIRILSHAGGGSAYIVGNREELEAALAELVADARIAERIRSLAA